MSRELVAGFFFFIFKSVLHVFFFLLLYISAHLIFFLYKYLIRKQKLREWRNYFDHAFLWLKTGTGTGTGNCLVKHVYCFKTPTIIPITFSNRENITFCYDLFRNSNSTQNFYRSNTKKKKFNCALK